MAYSYTDLYVTLQEVRGLKTEVLPGLHSFQEALGSVSLPFPASRGHLHSWFVTPSSIFRARKVASSSLPPLKTSLILTILHPPCDYTGPICITQDNLLRSSIISANSLLSCKITFLQVSGIRIWTSLVGDHYFAYHTLGYVSKYEIDKSKVILRFFDTDKIFFKTPIPQWTPLSAMSGPVLSSKWYFKTSLYFW